MSESTDYTPTGYFANRQVGTFKQYVKDGVLDAEGVKKDWLLNDAQIPQLEAELRNAGFLPKAAEPLSDSGQDKVTTAKLPPPATDKPTAGIPIIST